MLYSQTHHHFCVARKSTTYSKCSLDGQLDKYRAVTYIDWTTNTGLLAIATSRLDSVFIGYDLATMAPKEKTAYIAVSRLLLVAPLWVEHSTNGLWVRCSNQAWAKGPKPC